MVILELPWPPSVNHYWRRCGNSYFVSAEGKQFRDTTFYQTLRLRGHFSSHKRLQISIDAYPPDKRRRDLDNLLKSILDSLQYAEVYVDDNQIDAILIRRMPSRESKIVVTIQELEGLIVK